MNEERHRTENRSPASARITCRRTGRSVCADEHEDCPYCFGDMEDVLQGKREDFCDYRPGEDPVHFGFPPDSRRHGSG